MPTVRRSWTTDLLLRAAGVALLAICYAAMAWVFRSAAAPPPHDATALELGAMAVGFLSFSGGAALVVLGGHIFDQVDVSDRWARQSIERSRTAPIATSLQVSAEEPSVERPKGGREPATERVAMAG